jgi:ABC-type glycerol-3-phosphate transport system substrate-binding protein
MKKFLAVLLAAVTVTSVFAAPKKLVVWSFTDEMAKMIEYYKKANPDVQIEFVLVPNDVYQSKLKPVLQSGQGTPDIFTLEAAYVKGYVETGYMADLKPIEKFAKDTVAYTKEVTTSADGKLRGLSWQATPGAFFYRRSIAKKYLGTDDPAKIQKMLDSPAKFVEVGKTLKAKSNGSAVLISSLGDLFQVYKSGRKDGWVKGKRFVMDPLMVKLMEDAKNFRDLGIDGRQGQWGEGWFAGMKGALKDESGKPVEVFGYLLPTWGLHYVLKPNAGDTAGDWAMVQGPIPYFWGGTWIAAYDKSPNKDLAMQFIKFMTTDEKFLEQWAKDTGDLVSNTKVVDKIKDTYKEPFLGGQNHYAQFADMAKSVSAKILTGYDQDIETMFQEQMDNYVTGKKDLATATADFKAAVKNQYPDLTVR